MSHPIADPGYDSDSGRRDIPTCQHFLTKTPMERTISVSGGKKFLNREGRAICRIVAAHGWSNLEIGHIFQVSHTTVQRAVDNIFYNPRDRVEEDYQRVKDPEYKEHFPPVPGAAAIVYASRALSDFDQDDDEEDAERESGSPPIYRSNGRPSRAAKDSFYKTLGGVDEPEDNDSPIRYKRTRGEGEGSNGNGSSTSTPTKKPRKSEDPCGPHVPRRSNTSIFNGHPTHVQSAVIPTANVNTTISSPQVPVARLHPLPRRSLPQPTQTLAVFLQDVRGVDLSAHHGLLNAQGFTVPRFQTMAAWPKTLVEEALSRALMGRELVAGGWTPLGALDVVTLEVGIRKIKLTPAGSNPPPLTSALPPPTGNSNNNDVITLASFLRNVMGFDLSAHVGLFETQGFDVARLSTMATWEPEELQFTVERVLGPAGSAESPMSAIEMIALEFGLREAGEGWAV
ncbi:hypothetical protein FB45DRAFT_934402 [Roridomyces roridus]|uniref:Uncharacterized protein n=1 Tax=Roridomyces roridus TaxID=1738132 RepID=A0AAD7BBK3_9AGAR|nr:hypothetical protein FB45DRAFT_934402 [Roridomyces roridus]